MRHKVKKFKIGINKAHSKLMMRNLATSLIIYEKMKTTKTRAKAVQPFIEKLISIGKTKEKVTAIRQLMKLLDHENSSKKILEVLVPRFKSRNSGFTRITNLGYRTGDAAPVAQIEILK